MHFSARSAFDLAPNALTKALAARARCGAEVIDLTVSNPTRAGIPYDASAIRAALGSEAALVYEPEPFGAPRARAEVAAHLGVDPARVVLTASTSEAYALLFKLLCDPGDALLAPQPSYPLFDHLAQLEGVRLAPYRLAYDGAWHVDVDDLRAAAAREAGRARGVLVVAPNNPTGSYLTNDELAAIAALGLPIVSDEVFATYPLRADRGSRAWSALDAGVRHGALVFALGGLSKLAALPQLKLAWIAIGGPDALAAPALARLEITCDSFLSVGTPVQVALPTLLATRGIAHQAIAARTRRNLDALAARVRGTAATLLDVEGGWYATLRLPRVLGEEAWALDFLDACGVLAHPGAFFDFADEPYVVVSLLTPERAFDDGTARLVARVATHAR